MLATIQLLLLMVGALVPSHQTVDFPMMFPVFLQVNGFQEEKLISSMKKLVDLGGHNACHLTKHVYS